MADKSSAWRPGPTVCRCCLAEGCYKDISTEYFWMGKREVYADMLADTLSLSIGYSKTGGPNSNSRLICEPCISRLRDATDFKRQVQECEKTFMQYLDPGSSSVMSLMDSDDIQMETIEKDVKIEQVKVEKKYSDDEFDSRDFGDDDDDDDDMDQPLTTFASKEPKKETINLLDLLESPKKKTTKPKLVAKKKIIIKKDVKVKPTTSKAVPKSDDKKRKGSKPAEKVVPLFQVAYDRSLCRPLGTVMNFEKLAKTFPSQESFLRLATPSRSPSPLSIRGSPILEAPKPPQVRTKYPKNPDIRQNALLIFEFSSAYPFVYGNNTFKCFICSQPYQELAVLKQHVADTHTFTSLKRLINNRRENILKVDINDLTCKLCNDKPKDLVELKRHLKDHGKPIDPEIHDNLIPFKLNMINGSYQCVVCNETFIKVRILVIHMSVHFNNYSCEVCGSVFMTLRLLKKHLEVHETGNFPCDKCNKVFSTPYKRTVHVRGVHLKQFPRRCPFCPERFNSNYKRTIHLQDVHNQSTRVHKCETCGRGFNLKYHLLCHIRSVHLQERNQQCDVCHQRFCNKESLKRHMVIHTGEKNHKCDVCGMAFLRRKNLKDHLRLHEMG